MNTWKNKFININDCLHKSQEDLQCSCAAREKKKILWYLVLCEYSTLTKGATIDLY